MNLIEIILLAIALGVDCLVLSFSQGLVFNANRTKNSILLALTMGLFQGGMPIIGYFAAHIVSDYVETFANWIIFTIFLVLGIKFVHEAFQSQNEDDNVCCIDFRCLISMGIATSIDAMGAGVGLRFSDTNLILSMFIIGLVSFIMSLVGFWAGNQFKHLPSKYLEIFGGLILIGLALKAVM